MRADEFGHGLHCVDGEDRQGSHRHGRLQRAEGYVEEGLTAWRFMTDGAADLRLSPRSAGGRRAAQGGAAQGRRQRVRPGDFTDTGHFSWWPA